LTEKIKNIDVMRPK